MNIALRGSATQAVVDHFRARPFDWAGASCIHLAQAQALALGHAVPPVPKFRTAAGALRALKKQGAESTAALLDQWFERHPAPAFARMGDLVLLAAEDDAGEREERLAAIGIADGLGNIFSWHAANPAGLSQIKWAHAAIVAAWRL